MYNIDLTTFGGIIAALLQVIGGVLRLDSEVYLTVIQHPQGTRFAVLILFLGGLSSTLGQSVVLFANRVKLRRFLFSLVMYALSVVVSAFLWSVTIWFLTPFLTHESWALIDVWTVVALSYAPLIFGFLILLPYLGRIIDDVLRVWILLALLTGVLAFNPENFWGTLLAGFLGWTFLYLLSSLPIWVRVQQWYWRFATGTKKMTSTQELVQEYVAEIRAAANRLRRNTAVSSPAAPPKKVENESEPD